FPLLRGLGPGARCHVHVPLAILAGALRGQGRLHALPDRYRCAHGQSSQSSQGGRSVLSRMNFAPALRSIGQPAIQELPALPRLHRGFVYLLTGLFGLVAEAREYVYTDAHLHYVDFFQESEGMDKLLEQMDAHNIRHVMISGIPVAKKWHENEPRRPRYYAGDDAGAYWYSGTDHILAHALQQLDEQQRRRFHPFLSGFNPNDKNSDEHIRR